MIIWAIDEFTGLFKYYFNKRTKPTAVQVVIFSFEEAMEEVQETLDIYELMDIMAELDH